jgi:hypothetical protein
VSCLQLPETDSGTAIPASNKMESVVIKIFIQQKLARNV